RRHPPPRRPRRPRRAPPRPPMAGQPPIDPDGKRELGWRPDGAGLSYLQLEAAKKDEKDPRKDRVMLWLPPFGKDDTKVVYETPNRISGLQYSADCRWIFLTQMVDRQRQLAAGGPTGPDDAYWI